MRGRGADAINIEREPITPDEHVSCAEHKPTHSVALELTHERRFDSQQADTFLDHSDQGGHPPDPRTVTPQDDGSTFTMTVGPSSELVIRDPNAPDPVVTGDAIELIPVVNVTASGMREWEVRAVTQGSTTIRGSSPVFVVTVMVR